MSYIKGMKTETSEDQFRCHCCKQMQVPGSTLFWIPDQILRNDPVWAVENAIEANKWNGNFSGWCNKCVANIK